MIIVDKIDEFILDETVEKPAVQVVTAPTAPKQADKKLWLNISGMEDEDVEELLETLSFPCIGRERERF